MFDLARLADLATGPVPAALCTVVSTSGSTPRKAGASMVVLADGSDAGAIEGTIGGGAVEHEVRRVALEVIATTRPRTVEFSLTTQLGMCCGGTMVVFIEALRMRPPLILLGAGHVGQALCTLASTAGFDVHVADPRDELRTEARFPGATALHLDYASDDLDAMPFGPDAFVVVATHDHRTDQELVERVLARSFRYAALIGSQRKAVLTRERCANKGIADDVIARLRCPAGLDIGAETPEEIALSIVAELVQVRRQAESSVRRTKGASVRRATS
jgi:xanthine dehydrogenase accessory factor